MAFRSASKILPSVQRTCFDKSRCQREAARNVTSALQPQETEHYEAPLILHIERRPRRDTSPRRKDYVLFEPYKYKQAVRKPNFRFRRGDDIGERLNILKKIIRFSEGEVKELCKSAPRLGDVKLFDEVLRNIELLLYVYRHNQVVWLLRNRITLLTQIDNAKLMGLLHYKGKVQNITDLMQTIEITTKETDSGSVQPVTIEPKDDCESKDSSKVGDVQSGILSVNSEELTERRTNSTSDNGHLLNSTVQEKTKFLHSEGLSPEFLQNNDFILKYSMKRLKKEIQYVKKELGELDPQVLSSRIKGVPKKVIFYRSRKVAAKSLGCTEKSFTDLQTKYLFSLYPGVVKDSMTHLMSIGFTPEDIQSCVYIIGRTKEEIDKARAEVLNDDEIDTSNSQTFINAILYKIKKSEDS